MSKDQPFFSIITCTLNSDKYLQQNIKSVQDQSFTSYEHIFIDGFSKDKTGLMLNKHSKNFPQKVKIYQHRPQGISKAMNQGIEKSRGKYLIHLHSDDYFYDDNVLRDVREFLENNPELDWIYGKIYVIDKNNNRLWLFPNRKIWQISNKLILKYFNFIPHQAVFIKKTVFEKFGYFDEGLTSSMDIDLWLRIKNKTKWRFLDRIISNFRIHPSGQSSGKENFYENKQQYFKMLPQHLNILEIFFLKIAYKLVELRLSKIIR